jgi:hypothetical protein
MSVPFEQPRQKLHRAESHIRSLEAAIERYFRTNWHACQFGRSPNGQYSLEVAIRGQPEDFGLIVGDAVHNLRTALDLLAVGVVGRNGGSTKGVYFPFADSAGNLESMIARRNFDRASVADQDLLKSLRPYIGGNVLLRSLHDLDIQDKHHCLIPHASLITSPNVRVKTDAMGAPIGFADGKPELEVGPNETPKVKFTFPRDSVFSGEEVLEILWQLHEHVTSIVDRFAGTT